MKRKLGFLALGLVVLALIGFGQITGKYLGFTADRYWDNNGLFVTDSTIRSTGASNKLEARYDNSQYASLAMGATGTVTFDAVGTTPIFAFSDAVQITGVITQKYDAASYWTSTVADAGGVTFNDTSDGTAGFTFSDPVTISGLTSGRIPIAGTAGLLGDDSDLTFSTDTLTATKIIGTTSVTTAAAEINGTITLANDETIDNATNGTIALTSGVLKHMFDAAAYWTATQADAGAVTFDSVSDGTAGFAFSDKVDVTGVFKNLFDAAAYWTATQADAAGVTFDSVSDGTAGFAFSDAVSITGVLTNSFDAAAYWTATVADGGGVTFDSTSDGAASFAFSDPVTVTGNVTNTGVLQTGFDAAAYTTFTTADGAGLTIDVTSDGVASIAISDPVSVTGNLTNTGVFQTGFDAAAYTTFTTTDTGGITADVTSDGTASFTFADPIYLGASGTLKVFSHQADDLADDGTVSLPDATSGIVIVSCSAETIWCVVAADGSVVKGGGSTNTDAADTDTKLCVYDGGTAAVVKNRLGAAGEVRIIYLYN